MGLIFLLAKIENVVVKIHYLSQNSHCKGKLQIVSDFIFNVTLITYNTLAHNTHTQTHTYTHTHYYVNYDVKLLILLLFFFIIFFIASVLWV